MKREKIEQKAKELMWCVLKEHTWDEKKQIEECAIMMADWALSHQWVSVEDELPPKKNRGDYSDRVIIITEPLIISASCYDYERHRWLCGYAVTHWMPIPQFAEEGGEK